MYFLLGLIIGSFLNVVIYRLPEDRSVATGRSMCPQCGHVLGVWELVPLVSFFLQRGRCRHCRVRLSWRYPLVEALTGVAFGLLGSRLPVTGALVPLLVLTALLVAISFIDYDHYYIPDVLLLVGVGAWVGLRVFIPFIEISQALFGLALGFALMLVIYLVARGGMGFGDVKLAGLLGLYLGPAAVLLTLVLAFFIGAAVGLLLLAMKLKGRKDMVPFGPFLAAAAFLVMLWGHGIIRWYSHWMGF